MTEDDREGERISTAIAALLDGHSRAFQGAVLADVVAIYIAGHPPEGDEQLLTLFEDTVRDNLDALRNPRLQS